MTWYRSLSLLARQASVKCITTTRPVHHVKLDKVASLNVFTHSMAFASYREFVGGLSAADFVIPGHLPCFKPPLNRFFQSLVFGITRKLENAAGREAHLHDAQNLPTSCSVPNSDQEDGEHAATRSPMDPSSSQTNPPVALQALTSNTHQTHKGSSSPPAAAAASCTKLSPGLPPTSSPQVVRQTRPWRPRNRTAILHYHKRPECAEHGCTTQPKFNTEGEAHGVLCNKHKKDDMVNVLKTRCAEDGCKMVPSFNVKISQQGLYCSLHCKPDMVDVTHRKCQHEGCITQPSLNFSGEKRPVFCSKHAKKGMVDVVTQRCEEPGCEVSPSYGLPGSSYKNFCATHKKAGMVSRYRIKKSL